MQHWNIDQLYQFPETEIMADGESVSEILYRNEPYHGNPSRVFAYLGVPASNVPVPGMVLVHGGGGAAFPHWATQWNQRGYAAIAMDLGGCGPDGHRLADAGPPQNDEAKFNRLPEGWADNWTYHAVAAVIRAHTILRQQPTVDAERIGITGVSWGGYLACIIAGIDQRFRCAIPVYGCGFLQHNSAWLSTFAAMDAPNRAAWNEYCDPAEYIGDATMPLLFVNGTNDQNYPLDSYQLTYRRATAPLTLCIQPTLGHSHEEGWAPHEIGMFANQHLRGGPMLPVIGPIREANRSVQALMQSELPLARGSLVYTCDVGPIQNRVWHEQGAELVGNAVTAQLPAPTTAYYLTVTNTDGVTSCSPHKERTQ